MPVINLSESSDLSQIIASDDSLVVIDFYADWCAPCKVIAPVFERLSGTHKNVKFLKVDVDQFTQVAQLMNITAMPTFVFYKNKQEVDRLSGANQVQLEALVVKHSTPSTAAANESLSDNSAPAGFVCINEHIDFKQLDCLNKKDNQVTKSIFDPATTGLIESDVDEQLMIWVPFVQAVKVHSFRMTAPKATGPLTIKAFINVPNVLSFDDADSREPTETITISEKDLDGSSPIPVRFVKYQNVHSVQFFVIDNQSGDEVTSIHQIKLYGIPINAPNMNNLKKTDDDQ